MFVTTLVYKHPALLRKTTRENPVFVGPMFIHGRSQTDDYDIFFSHIASKLKLNNIVFGTDSEKALTNALTRCFPSSTHILCTQHLRTNLKEYMDKVGVAREERNTIVKGVFGDEGVLDASDEVMYDFRLRKVMSVCLNEQVKEYLTNKLMPSILGKVLEPSWLNGTEAR